MPNEEELAQKHWDYTSELIALFADGVDRTYMKKFKFLYISAFVHGWKHALQSMDALDQDQEAVVEVDKNGNISGPVINIKRDPGK